MRRRLSLAVAVLAVAAAAWLPAVPAAGAPAAGPVPGASPDFDGDGVADIVFSARSDASALVRVVYGTGRVQEIERDAPAEDSPTEFGRAILARDLNGDGYCDLAVTDAWLRTSAVFLYFGGPGGLDSSSPTVVAPPAGANEFGGSLALLTSPAPLLVVGGAQTAVVGGSFAAYPLGPDGKPAGASFWINQSSSGVPGTAEVGDRFGSSLAAAGAVLAVGVPGEDIGRVKDAGNVVVLRYKGGQGFSGKGFGQNSKGVADKPEAGDRFGESVAISRGVLAVGVPGEHDRGGMVQLFRVSGSSVSPAGSVDQNSKGVPGTGERFDRFGEAVDIAEVCTGTTGVVVGGPGESFSIGEDGAAWVIPLTRTSACPARLLAENGALGSSLSPDGNHLGADVGVLKNPGSPATVLIAGAGAEGSPAGRLFAVAAPYVAGNVSWQDTHIDNQFGFALSPAQ